MKTNYLLSIVLILGAVSVCFGYKAEVENIRPRKYFETLKREIDGARTSIVVYMYIFSLNPSHGDSLSVKLAEALVRAQERGVKVEVVLDQNVDFVSHYSKGTWNLAGKNWTAYDFLKSNGVPVYFDNAITYTHSKVTVIDGETVITGSGNWSQWSFTRNIETNVLIRSSELAGEILDGLATIERNVLPDADHHDVRVPLDFIESRNLMGRMVTAEDEIGFDVYMFLLKEYAEQGKPEIDLNFHDVALALGIKSMTRTGYRRKISKTLKRLQEKYKLIRFDKNFGKNARIRLNGISNPQEVLDVEKGKNITIPLDFWKYGWSKRLKHAGKVVYILGLYHSSISPIRPRWSRTGKTLAETYHVSPWFIRKGVTDLRRKNLIEVTYSEFIKESTEPRKPSIYTPNALYDPIQLEKAFGDLEKKHGRKKLKRAMMNAALVYEENDLQAIKKFIELEDEYGKQKIERAYKIIAAKNPDNPKRSPGYFFGTIEGLE